MNESMNQPYIFKKQIIAIIIIAATVFGMKIKAVSTAYVEVGFFYLLVVLSMTFTPRLRKNNKYPIIIHHFIYYSPMILPVFFMDITLLKHDVVKSVILGVISGLLLIASNYRHNKGYVSSKNHMAFSPLSPGGFLYAYGQKSYSIIAEEIFYRYVIIGALADQIEYYAVLISMVLFVYSHYLNRWANIAFDKRSYIYHCIIGVVLGCIFLYTHSLVGTIVAHFIFNSPEFVLLFIRLSNTQKNKTAFFNDY